MQVRTEKALSLILLLLLECLPRISRAGCWENYLFMNKYNFQVLQEVAGLHIIQLLTYQAAQA